MKAFSSEQLNDSAARLRGAIEALGSELTRPSYSRIAEKAGMHISLLSELVNGKKVLNARYAAKLAPVLGVTAGYLLGNEELPDEVAS